MPASSPGRICPAQYLLFDKTISSGTTRMPACASVLLSGLKLKPHLTLGEMPRRNITSLSSLDEGPERMPASIDVLLRAPLAKEIPRTAAMEAWARTRFLAGLSWDSTLRTKRC